MRAKVVRLLRKFVAGQYPDEFKYRNRQARKLWNNTPKNKRHALRQELS